MRLILGIGNPGRQYEQTRHNIGWVALDEFARRHGDGSWNDRFKSSVAEIRIDGDKVLLLKPQTFVNASGEALQAAMAFLKVPLVEVLVVTDDLALPFGQLRLRPSGSSGGHNGLKDIEARIGKEYARLRIGIGAVPPGWDQVGWVLGRFPPEEEAQLPAVAARAAEGILDWVRNGVTAACRVNVNPEPPIRP